MRVPLGLLAGGRGPAAGGGGGGPTPDVLEDFTAYTSNANFIANPRGIYVGATDEPTGGGPDSNGWQFLLDQTVGLNAFGYNLTQCMRYDLGDRTSQGGSGTAGRCGDATVDRGIAVSNPEVWYEIYLKFTSGFTVVAPGGWACTSGPEYKLVHGGVDVTSRFDLEMQSSRWIFGYPTNETSLAITSPTPASICDGNWHQFRFHQKLGNGTGRNTLWIDGTMVGDDQNIDTGANTVIREIYLAVNMNQGPGALQQLWWGRIAAYYTNPGW